MEQKVFIKKYPNRRLYNTLDSIYITIDDVAEIIKDGNRVEVQDASSGEDVTALVLTQIIMNKAKKDQGLLPVSLLHLVIQFGENQLHEFFETYLEKTMENYLIYRKTIDDQTTAYLEMGKEFSNLAEKTLNDLESFNMFSEVFTKTNKK